MKAKLTKQDVEISHNFAINVKKVCEKRGYVVGRLIVAAGGWKSLNSSLAAGKQRLSPELLTRVSILLGIPEDILISNEVPELYITEPQKNLTRRPAAIKKDSDHEVTKKLCSKCQYRSADSMPWQCDFSDFMHKCRRVEDFNHCPEFTKGPRLKESI